VPLVFFVLDETETEHEHEHEHEHEYEYEGAGTGTIGRLRKHPDWGDAIGFRRMRIPNPTPLTPMD
jgi:hypothetical protein